MHAVIESENTKLKISITTNTIFIKLIPYCISNTYIGTFRNTYKINHYKIIYISTDIILNQIIY